jgi:uncharacterized membrane protein (DUF485 family)
MKQWYFELEEKQGPIDESLLIDMIKDGVISKDTLINCEGDEGKPLSEFKEFTQYFEKKEEASPKPEVVSQAVQPNNSLSEMVKKIKRRNKIISGVTMLLASVFLFMAITDAEWIKVKFGSSGSVSTGGTVPMGLRKFGRCMGSGDEDCIPISENSLKLLAVQYSDSMEAISFNNFHLSGRLAYYTGGVLSFLLLISGMLLMFSLFNPLLIKKSRLINMVAIIPFVAFLIFITAFLLGGMLNIKAAVEVGGVIDISVGLGGALLYFSIFIVNVLFGIIRTLSLSTD